MSVCVYPANTEHCKKTFVGAVKDVGYRYAITNIQTTLSKCKNSMLEHNTVATSKNPIEFTLCTESLTLWVSCTHVSNLPSTLKQGCSVVTTF